MTRIAARKIEDDAPRSKKVRLATITLVSLLAFGLIAYVAHRFYANGRLSSYKTSLGTWVASKQPIVHAKAKQVNLAQAAEITREPIHFEFYSTLPNVQLKDPVSLAKLQPKTSVSNPTPENKIKAQLAFKADEIEREFSKEFQAKNYILQLAVFSNFSSAEKYSLSLKKAGVRVAVVKLNQGKHITYRIQHGPFKDAAHAKAMQRKLQTLGFKSIVRKLA